MYYQCIEVLKNSTYQNVPYIRLEVIEQKYMKQKLYSKKGMIMSGEETKVAGNQFEVFGRIVKVRKKAQDHTMLYNTEHLV